MEKEIVSLSYSQFGVPLQFGSLLLFFFWNLCPDQFIGEVSFFRIFLHGFFPSRIFLFKNF